MPIAPPALVVGAPRVALPYGLFSTFSMRPGSDRFEAGVQFETPTCDPAYGIGDWVVAPDTRDTLGLPKDLDPNLGELGQASPFTVYGHFSCSPVGFPPADAQERATAHLLSREEARVEQAFWTGDLGNVPSLQGADTVLGTAGDGVVGLGLIEEYIASHYGSTGVIHMSRATATILLSHFALIATGGRLRTQLGTPVAAGAGYPGTGPAGEAIDAGTSWIYGSPAVFGYRSEVFTSSAIPGDLLDRAVNNLFAVAERTYLLGFDPCGVGAALIKLEGITPS